MRFRSAQAVRLRLLAAVMRRTPTRCEKCRKPLPARGQWARGFCSEDCFTEAFEDRAW